MSVKLKSKSRKRKKNAGWVVLLLIVVLLVGGFAVAIHNLSEQAAAYAAREAELESMIAAEEGRAYEYQEQSKFQQTLRYIEMIAREKLGLVFPGEVILKPDE